MRHFFPLLASLSCLRRSWSAISPASSGQGSHDQSMGLPALTHRSLTRASSSSFVHWCVHSFRACSGSRHAHTTEKRRSRVHSTIAPARASHLRSARALSLLLSCSSACFGTTSSIADHALGALGAPRRSAVCETSGRLEANAEVESARARARPPFHDQTHGWGAQDHVEICFRPRQRPGCPARSEPQPAAASSSVRTAVCHQNRTLPTSKSARIQSPRHLPRPSRAHVRWPTALGDARRARPTMARAAAQPDRLCRYNSLRTLARGPALRAIAEHRAASSQASPDADVESKPLRADAAPQTPPASAQQVERLAEFVTRCKNLMVLTGAGLSTESGIPDYRGPRGAYKTGFKPMMHQQFLASETNRRRYWARSFVGWQEFAGSKPNAGHAALARLEGAGWVSGIVTQNVDRLHQRAGSERVVELHGTTHEVVCLDCGHIEDRYAFQRKMDALNPKVAMLAEQLLAGRLQRRGGAPGDESPAPRAAVSAPGTFRPIPSEDLRAAPGVKVSVPGMMGREGKASGGHAWTPVTGAAGFSSAATEWRAGAEAEELRKREGPAPARPDGDAELGDASELYDNFQHPPCESCGSLLVKPNVVFFGDSIPREHAAEAQRMAEECDGVLVCGSSLMVWSAFRLAKLARDRGMPVAALTVGETRADEFLELKVEARAGETLARVAAHPSLQFKW